MIPHYLLLLEIALIILRSPVNTYYFSVESISKLEKVEGYFSTYPLIGIKGLDSLDFIRVYNMIKNKNTLQGEKKIRLITAGMNKNRKYIFLPYKQIRE